MAIEMSSTIEVCAPMDWAEVPARPLAPPSRSGLRTLSSRAIHVILGCLFLLSGVSKIQNPYSFLMTLYQYELLGPHSALAVAVALPWLEVVLGMCLIVGLMPRSTAILAALLLALFVGVLASMVVRGIRASCGCFGELSASDVTWATVARSAGFLALALVGLWAHVPRRSPS